MQPWMFRVFFLRFPHIWLLIVDFPDDFPAEQRWPVGRKVIDKDITGFCEWPLMPLKTVRIFPMPEKNSMCEERLVELRWRDLLYRTSRANCDGSHESMIGNLTSLSWDVWTIRCSAPAGFGDQPLQLPNRNAHTH